MLPSPRKEDHPWLAQAYDNSYTNGSKMSLNSASEDEVEQAKKLFWESQVKLADV